MTVDHRTERSPGRHARVSLHEPGLRESRSVGEVGPEPGRPTDDGDVVDDGGREPAALADENPAPSSPPVDQVAPTGADAGQPVIEVSASEVAPHVATPGLAPTAPAPAVPDPAWRRLLGPASVPVVTALQLVLALAVGVVLTEHLPAAAKGALVLALLGAVVLSTWPVGDRRTVQVLADLVGYAGRRLLARRSTVDAQVVLPPLVVGRASGPDGPEMGVVHDGAGWAAIALVGARHHLETDEVPASWLPETVEALARVHVDHGAQVVLERDGRGVETLVAVRIGPGSSPAGGVLGGVDGVAPLLRHRLRIVDEALEPTGLTVRALDPGEVVGQLTRAFALDDPLVAASEDAVDRPRERIGEHRACVVSDRGVEQLVTIRSGASTPARIACELEALALRLPGHITVAVDMHGSGRVDDVVMRVGVPPGNAAGSLAAATRRAMPPSADLLLPHWRQVPRYVATLPLGRRT